jgi:hypothetical protein
MWCSDCQANYKGPLIRNVSLCTDVISQWEVPSTIFSNNLESGGSGLRFGLNPAESALPAVALISPLYLVLKAPLDFSASLLGLAFIS